MMYCGGRGELARLSLGWLLRWLSGSRLQVVLACDGVSDFRPAGVELVEVPRSGDFQSFGAIWNAGVRACRYPNVLYIDCDRVVPVTLLGVISRDIPDGVFLYPDRLFRLTRRVGPVRMGRLMDGAIGPELVEEVRTDDPSLFPAKCPFSGCTAFNLKTFDRCGPMDPGYLGYGYPDIDYFMRSRRANLKCATIPGVELHQFHGRDFPDFEFGVINVWNRVRYHAVWGLEPDAGLLGSLDGVGLSWGEVVGRELGEVLCAAKASAGGGVNCSQ